MRKENRNQAVIRLNNQFLRVFCHMVVVAALMLSVPAPTVTAQTRYTAFPTRWFMDLGSAQDLLYPDYVVEFEIPLNATNIAVYTATAGIESRVLAFSTVYPNWGTRNGKKVVRVVTGYRARKCSSSYNPFAWTCNYTGSVYQWACSLRLRYYR